MPETKQFDWKRWRPALVGFGLAGGLVLALTGSLGYALGVLLGPFAGGFVREWQACCGQNSFTIAPFALGALGLAQLIQVKVAPDERGRRYLRSITWWLASLGWFVAALLSYAHALE